MASLTVGECAGLASPGLPEKAFGRPKLSTITAPSGVTMTFAGFESL
jgi:hypothetical protein